MHAAHCYVIIASNRNPYCTQNHEPNNMTYCNILQYCYSYVRLQYKTLLKSAAPDRNEMLIRHLLAQRLSTNNQLSLVNSFYISLTYT